MRDGLYKAAFSTPIGSGNGVVVLEDGNIRGGDHTLYYTGSYTVEGNQITAHLKTDRHSTSPGHGSVFGRPQVNAKLTGLVNGDVAKVSGEAAEAPGVKFQATLTRLCD